MHNTLLSHVIPAYDASESQIYDFTILLFDIKIYTHGYAPIKTY